MPIIYTDNALLENHNHSHPAMQVDTEHPCFRMVREAIEGKSVFHWDKEQAYQMYKWYVEDYHNYDIQDEFGEHTSDWDFKKILKASHFYVQDGKKKKISDITIEEMWNAVQMEKKILASIGEEKEEE